MRATIEGLKRTFREGRQAEAITTCEKELQDFKDAADSFTTYTSKFPDDAGGWANLAECRFQLNAFEEGLRLARLAVGLDPLLAPELAKSRVTRATRCRTPASWNRPPRITRRHLHSLPGTARR
jgi:tetratricopeptide (TPR) repeat protein